MAQKKSTAKSVVYQLHLFLGLTTGILVFLISITGCIYVFRDELYSWFNRDIIILNEKQEEPLPIHVLWEKAQQDLGQTCPIDQIICYNDPLRAWELKSHAHNEKAITYFDWVKHDFIVYINPYTAEIKGVVNHKYEFFQLVKMLHWSLLLKTEYGQPIVGWSVFIFAISLITGLILWWPKKIKNLKQRLAVKWKAKWKRLNYDLHYVPGFYIYPLGLIAAFTGMVWSFKWFMGIVYFIANMSLDRPAPQPKIYSDISEKETTKHYVFDEIYADLKKRFPDSYSYLLHQWELGDSTGTVYTYIKNTEQVYYDGHILKYDRYDASLLQSRSFTDLNTGEKLITMNYDIHVGQVWGLFGKILAFIASLVCASLPVTGFLVWYGRNFKKSSIR